MPPKAAGIVEPVPVRGEVIAYAEMGSTIYKRPGVLGGEVHVHADDEIEVPESIYNEFLKGYNTVTVRMEELSVYAAEYKFGTSFQKSKVRHFVRRSYPWDDAPSVFSDAEIKEAANAMEKYAHPLENDTYENLSVSFPYNYQMHGGGDQCLSDEAVEYIFEKS